MKRLSNFTSFIALACFLSLGCQPTQTKSGKAPAKADEHSHEHGGHEHPKNLLEGFQQLGATYTVIKTAFETDKLEDAHAPLHDVAHLLEDLKGLVEKSELDADAKTKVTAGVDSLFDSFGKIDAYFHGGPKVEFAELDKSIAPVMDELKGLIK